MRKKSFNMAQLHVGDRGLQSNNLDDSRQVTLTFSCVYCTLCAISAVNGVKGIDESRPMAACIFVVITAEHCLTGGHRLTGQTWGMRCYGEGAGSQGAASSP
jgi:hypothetical protein